MHLDRGRFPKGPLPGEGSGVVSVEGRGLSGVDLQRCPGDWFAADDSQFDLGVLKEDRVLAIVDVLERGIVGAGFAGPELNLGDRRSIDPTDRNRPEPVVAANQFEGR